jgi:hypothetical protein
VTKRARRLLFVFLATSVRLHAQASAQQGCDKPYTNEWLTQSPGDSPVAFDSPQVVPVTRHLVLAIAKLDSASIVPLPPDQVLRFTGAMITQPGLQPYLVRAVFPTLRPHIGIAEKGNNLTIFADGMGCAPYVKHPIVIFLKHKPNRVFVSAAAVL